MSIVFDNKLFVFFWLIGIILAIFYYKKDKKSVIVSSIFVFYLLCLVKIAFFPIMTYGKVALEEGIKYYIQWIPFREIMSELTSSRWYIQILGNIILLFPFPIFINILFKQRGKYNIKMSIILGVVMSIGIESIQLLIDIILANPVRVASIDDIILNSTGVCLGALLYYIFENFIETKSLHGERK